MRRAAPAVAALALGALLAAPASAKDGAQPTAREVFAKSLPQGWRLEPASAGAPEVVARGPRAAPGPAVVTFRAWPRAVARPRTADDLAALARRLGVERVEGARLDGPLGPELDGAPREGLRVRYVLGDAGLLTIVAPPRLLPSAQAWAGKALARLPRSAG